MKFLKNANFKRGLIVSLIMILSVGAAFGLGRLSVLMGEKEPIVIEEPPPLTSLAAALPTTTTLSVKTIPEKMPEPEAPAPSEPVVFVASRTGKSYYFPWCGIVKRIKKENLISFTSKTEAEKAGYSPGNCAGLK